MMSLTELYASYIPEEGAPVLGDILFNAAFPKNKEKEEKRVRRLSEDTFEDFYKKWEVRITAAMKKELEDGSSPHTILKLVHYITKDELNELLQRVDTFAAELKPQVEDAAAALIISELETHVMACAQAAGKLFQQLYQEHQEEERKRVVKPVRPNIITP